jgi:hypothetical protein
MTTTMLAMESQEAAWGHNPRATQESLDMAMGHTVTPHVFIKEKCLS